MSKLRIIGVLLVVVGLASIELVTGFSRLSGLRDGRTHDLQQVVTRGHDQLGERLRVRLDAVRQQAAYLALSSDIVDRLAAPGEPSGDAVAPASLPAPAALTAFLSAFPDVRRVALLDASRTEISSAARAPDGAPETTTPAPDVEAARLVAIEQGLYLPPLDPEGDAEPILLTARVEAPPLRELVGWVVITLSPEPLQEALAGFGPVDHLHTRLLPDRPPVSARDGEGLLLRTHVTATPGFLLETEVPDSALDAAMAPLSREYSWIVGSMVGVTVALVLLGALVLRLGQRAFRLNETEHYLRWIRRVTDRYRALMEGAADMILIVEPDGLLREANAAARAALALAEEEPPEPDAKPRTPVVRIVDRVAPDDRARFIDALDAAADSGRPVAAAALRIPEAGGGEHIVDGHFARIDLGDEHVVEVSLRDVTRQRAVERQLQIAQRLSSLGLLTAGVAHEINNPLEGIGNYLALLERPDTEPTRREHYLSEIRRGLSRIRDIVQDLLTFARPDVASDRADLTAVVDSALGIVRYLPAFKSIRVEHEGLDAPLEVAGDAGRLEQVVLNLLLNAARAMEGDGRIQLAAERIDPGDGAARIALSVADTGPGLPPETHDRLFDPFYSDSGGTGLGLSVSFGIAEAHGGSLRARNRSGGGAVFTLEIPVLDHGGPPSLPGRADHAAESRQ